MICPKCRKVQYFVCGNKLCSCWKSVPKGKKPQKVSSDGNHLSCPYCGFKKSFDYWESRDLGTMRTVKI
jgi:DNA-directed RNA polymerase subunit RPC12/RpoP